MSKAIKLLVCGFEATGKSTITSQIRDALVINFDRKEYGFKVPHVNIPTYAGLDDLINTINTKVGIYKEKFGELPHTIVLDTVTQFYSAMQKYNGEVYKGFDIHTMNNKDTLALNGYIEDVLISNGVNVVIVAHTVYDADTSRHIIPASGQFAKAGSWLSVVNDSIFLERKSGKIVVHTKSMKFPARTTLPDMEASVPMEDYDINKHIDRLAGAKIAAAEFEI